MSYTILSLDGGGTWALIQARILENRYGAETTGHEVLQKYDLVIANSGGSLVLAMLCANMKLKYIVARFNTPSILQDIFKKKVTAFLPFIKGFVPNYSAANKYTVFKQYLNTTQNYGEMLLSDLPEAIGKPSLNIIITAFDYDGQRASYFRSNPLSKMESSVIMNAVNNTNTNKSFTTVTLAQAVHASSNAPVMFFDAPAEFPVTTNGIPSPKNRLYWDGAVGANNNPIKSGVLEAIANGVNENDIRVVSIGTSLTLTPILYGEPNEPAYAKDFLIRKSEKDGYLKDVKRMSTSILSDPPDAATFDSHVILKLPFEKPNSRLIRINPLVKPLLKANKWEMPGSAKWTTEQMKKLFELDMAVANQEGITILNQLCDDFFNDLFDNQGVRLGGPGRTAILGHSSYSQAFSDWQAWNNH